MRRVETYDGSFCTSGAIPGGYEPSDVKLKVKGIGPISLPIASQEVETLKAVSEQAPHGRGTETIVDTQVRNMLQINPSKVSFGDNDTWEDFIYNYVGPELGVSQTLVEARLYKLLLYEPGSFFVKHRGTKKEHGMFGTLVVQLPSKFKGGKFVVTHKAKPRPLFRTTRKDFTTLHTLPIASMRLNQSSLATILHLSIPCGTAERMHRLL